MMPPHERPDMTPRERFAYAFQDDVLEIDPDKLAALVGHVLALFVAQPATALPKYLPREIIDAAEAIYRDLEPAIVAALDTTPEGRFQIWKHEENR